MRWDNGAARFRPISPPAQVIVDGRPVADRHDRQGVFLVG